MDVEELKENKSRRMNNTLFVEKFRPQTIKDIVMTISMRKFFNKCVEEKEVPNLIFHSSSPGTSKTTTALALVNDIGADHLYINTSLERGIDILRDRIEKFCSSIGMNGGKKIVIFDEFDGATLDLMKALKASIERFENCRFIFIANSLNKIIKPIHSRCQIIDFSFGNPKDKEYMIPKITKRVCDICAFEKLEYNSTTIEKLVQKYFPDTRNVLNLVQKFSKQNGIINDDIFTYAEISIDLINLILEKKFTKARELINKSGWSYSDLYRFLYTNLVDKLPKTAQAQAILLIAEYSWREAQGVLDSEINFAALMLEIISLL
jgi:DNA polymerase III delta prime subunit